MKNPLDIIKKHFEYLIDEYNYQIANEEFSPQAMGNAYITYLSPAVGVQIVIDRSQVLINIGDIVDNIKEWFDFSDVIKFFNPSIKDPYIFIEKSDKNTEDDIITLQVERLASALRQDCEPLLKGELWMKENIKGLEKKRVAEMLGKLSKLSN